MLTILPPNEKTWDCLYQCDSRYLVGEMVQVRVTRKGFQPEYLPLPKAEWQEWQSPVWLTKEEIIGHDNWACFFAFWQEKFAGQVIVRPTYYGICELLDIRVNAADRRQGIATELMSACESWAEKRGLHGIVAEVSDQNPVACQFFQNSRFALGGVDKLRHYADPAQAEKPAAMRASTLSFYRFF